MWGRDPVPIPPHSFAAWIPNEDHVDVLILLSIAVQILAHTAVLCFPGHQVTVKNSWIIWRAGGIAWGQLAGWFEKRHGQKRHHTLPSIRGKGLLFFVLVASLLYKPQRITTKGLCYVQELFLSFWKEASERRQRILLNGCYGGEEGIS